MLKEYYWAPKDYGLVVISANKERYEGSQGSPSAATGIVKHNTAINKHRPLPVCGIHSLPQCMTAGRNTHFERNHNFIRSCTWPKLALPYNKEITRRHTPEHGPPYRKRPMLSVGGC